MKTNLFFASLALMMSITFTSLYAQSDKSIIRKVAVTDFSSIDMESVGDILFTQGADCSLRLEGPKKALDKIAITVKSGKLIIGFKEGENKDNKGRKVKFYITAPDLKQVNVSGVGSFHCDKALKLDNLKLGMNGVGAIDIANLTCKNLKVELEGVGKVNIHVNCNTLVAHADGVGHVTLSGRAGTAQISKDGVGGVNTKDLKIGK